jgi:type I restriction enzyme S subunit
MSQGIKSQFIEMFNCSAERVALSSLCNTFIDGDWIEAKDQSDSGIRLIQTGNVGVGTFKDKGDKARYISEDTFNRLNCTEVVEGDVLISRLPDPVGRACIIPAGLGKSITAVDCTIIRLNDKVLPKFFVAFTSTPDYAMQIKKVLSGTTRLRVSRANLGKIQVPLPSVDKQQQFVTIAEQADKSVFELRKSIDAIDAVIKSLINI